MYDEGVLFPASLSAPALLTSKRRRESPSVIDLDARIEEALKLDDGHRIQEILQDPNLSRSLIVCHFLKMVAIRMSNKSLNANIRKEASFYFSLYATEADPDDVATLAVMYLDPSEAAGYISYCTRGGWSRVMRAALGREDSVLIRYIWDIPERPRRQGLRKILITYLQEIDTNVDPSSPRDPALISRDIFKFLIRLVKENEGYLLTLLQEDSLASGLTSIYEILDHV